MRTIKFNDRALPVNALGTAVIVCMDELHADIFKLTTVYVNDLSENIIPPISIISKVMYCFIKAANPDLFKTYLDFMSSTKSIEPFLNVENLNILSDEIADFFGTEEDTEKKDDVDSSKKKTAK